MEKILLYNLRKADHFLFLPVLKHVVEAMVDPRRVLDYLHVFHLLALAKKTGKKSYLFFYTDAFTYYYLETYFLSFGRKRSSRVNMNLLFAIVV